jgi:hypothetical protein
MRYVIPAGPEVIWEGFTQVVFDPSKAILKERVGWKFGL